ncbi:MAG: hypothetical protein GTN40_00905 [Candidatus Aenigmarchaeota archaeon]|nr:hypothetical protein [Candidatus Aenigmarchaeota archaeon]
MPKIIYEYPDEERLEVLVLANSPCTPSELLKIEKIPVKPNTLETLRKKLDWLVNQGKLKKKRVAQGNVYWHMSIENYKKKTLMRATEELVRTDGRFDES